MSETTGWHRHPAIVSGEVVWADDKCARKTCGEPVLVFPASGARETVARALASLGPGEDWPTNGSLGGGLTGTRDDEFRDGMYEVADAVLAALATPDPSPAALDRTGEGE